MSSIDVIVMVIMAIGVTWMGHILSGSIKNRSSFFQADGSLPWWAVSSSIIATVVSSVTFVSVPAAIFRDGGNLLYFQVILGLMLGKIVTAILFVKPYYQSKGIDTTYGLRYCIDRCCLPAVSKQMQLSLQPMFDASRSSFSE